MFLLITLPLLFVSYQNAKLTCMKLKSLPAEKSFKIVHMKMHGLHQSTNKHRGFFSRFVKKNADIV